MNQRNDVITAMEAESYQRELDAAKQRIAELEGRLSGMTDMYKQEFRYREAAERKLVTAREILSENDPDVAQMEPLGRLTVAIKRIQRTHDVLAKIEQPQEP
jgi:predicted  nucleic acid-binding Zn-ribbon protein